jgi:DNA-binding NtrC family response regulator
MSVRIPESIGRCVFDALQTAVPDDIRLCWAPEAPESDGDCDLVILHVRDGEVEAAVDEIRRLRLNRSASSAIAVCVALNADQIAALLGAGAIDFVSAPLQHCGELGMRIQRAAGLLPRRPQADANVLRTARQHNLLGSSACFTRQLAMLPTMAQYDASVLVLGETGTGKEVFTRAIHYLSPRASRPLIPVNCGAIPTELMESELFGCVRGAYTSANAPRRGLVREAEGGTLFLDEIDALPLGAQTKLLRLLQEKEFRPVGGKSCHADIRIVAASNHDLSQLVERGLFRRDLYFRLNVLSLTLPPLRERRDDIPELAHYFAAECCRQRLRPPVTLTAQAVGTLMAHDWPGNIRELQNVIERAVLFCNNPLLGADDLQLGAAPAAAEDSESFRAAKARTVEIFERSYIERLLTINAGNITRAASAARKNRRAFFALMRKHSIAPERFKRDAV